MKTTEKLKDRIIQMGSNHMTTMDRVNKLEKCLEIAVTEMKVNSDTLDSIKYELYASVYTLTDDEFELVFLCRDRLLLSLTKIKAIREGRDKPSSDDPHRGLIIGENGEMTGFE